MIYLHCTVGLVMSVSLILNYQSTTNKKSDWLSSWPHISTLQTICSRRRSCRVMPAGHVSVDPGSHDPSTPPPPSSVLGYRSAVDIAASNCVYQRGLHSNQTAGETIWLHLFLEYWLKNNTTWISLPISLSIVSHSWTLFVRLKKWSGCLHLNLLEIFEWTYGPSPRNNWADNVLREMWRD